MCVPSYVPSKRLTNWWTGEVVCPSNSRIKLCHCWLWDLHKEVADGIARTRLQEDKYSQSVLATQWGIGLQETKYWQPESAWNSHSVCPISCEFIPAWFSSFLTIDWIELNWYTSFKLPTSYHAWDQIGQICYNPRVIDKWIMWSYDEKVMGGFWVAKASLNIRLLIH